jgi:hypothetical protein
MVRRVFFSFHYDNDRNRSMTVWCFKMGGL